MRREINLFILGILFGSLVATGVYSYYYTSHYCYTEEVFLLKQYLADEPQLRDLRGCNSCLHIKVVVNNTMRTYFFANEYELKPEWQPGDILVVRWCKVNGRYLIRGVWKKEEV